MANAENDQFIEALEQIIDSAEADVAALILAVSLSGGSGLTAASKFSVENAVKAFKRVKESKKLSNGMDIALMPSVIAAADLLRKNMPVGSLYDTAKSAAYSVASKASNYYDSKAFQDTLSDKTPASKQQSAMLTARWMIRGAVFSALSDISHLVGHKNKRWVTRGDDKVRHSHQALDGQVVPIGKKFTIPNSGVQIAYPGDMTAPISETANCRCLMTFE